MQIAESTVAERRDRTVIAASRATGVGYSAGQSGRLEPTAWTLLALAAAGQSDVPAAAQFLVRAQREDGWLVEDPTWPVNIGFNALVAFTWFAHQDLAPSDARTRLLAALAASKGVQAPNQPQSSQDNSLQGWSWIDGTFSWVEPTSLGLLALKRARTRGGSSQAADARIAEAERLLVNRTCREGGWNFGNAVVLDQDLRPYVPTTALALLALQDRRDDAAVVRSLEYLEAHWPDEISSMATGLSLICLDVFDRPTDRVAERLRDHLANTASDNLHGSAVALYALSARGGPHAFRL